MIESPIGQLTLVAEDGALVGLYMERHRRREPLGDRVDAGFDDVTAQLGGYFAGTRTDFDLVIRPAGDEFQRRVWDLLRTIPYGETRSYGQLARELGDPALAKDVGAANARNPLSIVVPCHRVIGADGRLVGYAGGVERKAFLLDLERQS
jgi:methylated-DNA-[protein]-cysteine S-methyltransferase